jgi:thioredoxin-related protein
MKLARTLLFALALLPPSEALAQKPARGAPLEWRSWNQGVAEAASSGRPMLVDVYTDWCGWCKRMDRDVYARADVRDYLSRRFVTVKLDAEGSQAARYEGRAFTGTTLAKRFKVTGYPTTVFLRADGGHLVNVPGYVPPERFLTLLRYVGEGAMERGEDFEAFARRAPGGR